MVAKMPNDGLPRRVEALLDMLAAASLDTVDNYHLERELIHCTLELSRPTEDLHLPETPQAWDKNIEKMIRQLKDAVKETPERMTEESPDPPLRDNSYTDAAKEYEPEELPEVTDEDRRQYLEREFSSTSYPKIGPGYSDSISVVSELTIPTVVPGMNVPDEEDYSRPPPSIGMTLEFSTKPSRSSRDQQHAPPHRQMSTEQNSKPKPRNKTAQYSNSQSSRRPNTNIATLRPPSMRIVPTAQPPVAAAARRRQSHQATMLHLGEISGPSLATTTSRPTGAVTPLKTEMTVNDFPSLNESPNFFEIDDDDDASKRRSLLLRKSDNYARAVPTASSRMLLSNQNPSKTKKATKYGGIMSRRGGGRLQEDEAGATTNTEKNIDLDGVLSTMGQDIDFIFRELTALEEDVPIKKVPDSAFSDSNLGATAKIKNTLGSVEKYLRKDEPITPSFDAGVWPSSLAEAAVTVKKATAAADPLLIDEDGFIISADPNANPFGDPFAIQPMEASPTSDFGFETSFFQSSTRDTKPRNSSRNQPKASRRSSDVGSLTSASKQRKGSSSKSGSKASKSGGPDNESRIDAVELATKKKIDMLRQLVAERAGEETRGGSKQALDHKLDFVEAETMKQIARLRDRMGESRRHLEQR